VAQLGAFLKERKANSAYLLLEGASARSSKHPLSKNGFSIGNSKTADLSIGGWFAPRIAAKIMLQSDGFYISPEMRGRVCLNGVSVSKLTKLHDGDNLTIRGTALKFVNRPSSG
jgi:predicted component of type VI protein secretion system